MIVKPFIHLSNYDYTGEQGGWGGGTIKEFGGTIS